MKNSAMTCKRNILLFTWYFLYHQMIKVLSIFYRMAIIYMERMPNLCSQALSTLLSAGYNFPLALFWFLWHNNNNNNRKLSYSMLVRCKCMAQHLAPRSFHFDLCCSFRVVASICCHFLPADNMKFDRFQNKEEVILGLEEVQPFSEHVLQSNFKSNLLRCTIVQLLTSVAAKKSQSRCFFVLILQNFNWMFSLNVW